jgi:hypothetical protein
MLDSKSIKSSFSILKRGRGGGMFKIDIFRHFLTETYSSIIWMPMKLMVAKN